MVVRGGFGVFHSDIFSTIDAFEAYQNAEGFRSVTFVPGDALFPQFPSKLPGPTLPPGVTAAPGAVYMEAAEFAPDLRQHPESHNYTVGFERQFWKHVLRVGRFQLQPRAQGRRSHRRQRAAVPRLHDRCAAARRSRAMRCVPSACPVGRSPLVRSTIFPTATPSAAIATYGCSSRPAGSTTTRCGSSSIAASRMATACRRSTPGRGSTNNGDDFRDGNSLPLDPANRALEEGRGSTDIPAPVLGQRHRPTAVGVPARWHRSRAIGRDGRSAHRPGHQRRSQHARAAGHQRANRRAQQLQAAGKHECGHEPGATVPFWWRGARRSLRGVQSHQPFQRQRREQRLGSRRHTTADFHAGNEHLSSSAYEVSGRVSF